MVFSDSKAVQSDLISVLDLLDEVPYPLRRVFGAAGLIECRRETIDADLHLSPCQNSIISRAYSFGAGTEKS